VPSSTTTPPATLVRRAWPTHVALVVVQIAFAIGAVEGKLAMSPAASGGGDVDPSALAMARMLGAAAFFHGFAALTGTRSRTTLRDHVQLAGLSVIGIVLNQALFLYGLAHTAAFSAALLGATIPVFTAGLAVLFRQERASARTAIGLTLALVGVLWLTGVRALDWGALIIAVNCLGYSFYLVLSRGIIRRLGAITVVTWIFTWGAVLFAPIGARALATGFATWSPRAWLLVGVVLALPTVVAYIANAWALGRSTPSLVTIYIYLQPLITALLQWVQRREGLSARMIVAASMILVGVGVVASRHRAALASSRPTRGT
jgi:drug/metabolite transporter (DMT)-like permease